MLPTPSHPSQSSSSDPAYHQPMMGPSTSSSTSASPLGAPTTSGGTCTKRPYTSEPGDEVYPDSSHFGTKTGSSQDRSSVDVLVDGESSSTLQQLTYHNQAQQHQLNQHQQNQYNQYNQQQHPTKRHQAAFDARGRDKEERGGITLVTSGGYNKLVRRAGRESDKRRDTEYRSDDGWDSQGGEREGGGDQREGEPIDGGKGGKGKGRDVREEKVEDAVDEIEEVAEDGDEEEGKIKDSSAETTDEITQHLSAPTRPFNSQTDIVEAYNALSKANDEMYETFVKRLLESVFSIVPRVGHCLRDLSAQSYRGLQDGLTTIEQENARHKHHQEVILKIQAKIDLMDDYFAELEESV